MLDDDKKNPAKTTKKATQPFSHITRNLNDNPHTKSLFTE